MSDDIAVVASGEKMGKIPGEVVGYYDHKRRRVGERFVIHREQDFSRRWMQRVTEKEARETKEELADTRADHRRKTGRARASDDSKI